MRALTPDEIEIALSRLETGLERYLWLERHFRLCDVSTNEEFQRCFSGFYKVRRDSEWRAAYYSLLESAKAEAIDFPMALNEIKRHTGRIEASFASKLVATLDPSKPVIDKFVLEHFELRLPRLGTPDREAKTIAVYYDLCDKYIALIQSSTGKSIRELFDGRYPSSKVTDLKKVDLVLWQIRPRSLYPLAPASPIPKGNRRGSNGHALHARCRY